MSYQVLARKWRPRKFSLLVGQEHVVKALTHALNEQRLHHAYLFTGTRGVGKTTIARILAKSLNCEAGVSSEPCGVCTACQEIDAGRFVDLLEVDAATNTRVDEMRQLLEDAVYAPTRGRYKVYVIDEVHMLSGHAFNAMLKTLEEPPEHVKFVLATTDPQKIPVTVLSRCLQFNLKQMPVAAITGHLEHILLEEGIPFEPEALGDIARAAAGSMRDALSLLDQAIAHGGGLLKADQVRQMLGVVDTGYLLDILETLLQEDGKRMLDVVNLMQERSLSAANALQGLAMWLTRIQLCQLVSGALDEETAFRERLDGLARRFSPEFIQLAYQIVTQGRQDLALAPDEYSGFLMTLLRLLAFKPLEGEGFAPSATLLGQDKKPSAEKTAPPAQDHAPQKAASPAQPPVQEGITENQDWHTLAASLEIKGMVKALAQHCDLAKLDENSCTLRLAPSHRHLLSGKTHQEQLQQALSQRLGRNIRLQIEVAEISRETPAQTAEKNQRERQKKAVASIESDPFVQSALDILDASLLGDSIQSIDEP